MNTTYLSLRWRSIGAFLGACILCFLCTLPASAQAQHAILLRSEPAEESTVRTAPTTICLWFSESAQPVGETISVLTPSGSPARVGHLSIRGTRFCVPISIQASGSYLISWQVISLDTDPTSGSFIFHLRQSGGLWANTTSSGVSPQGITLQVFARLLHFLGYALSFGVISFGWFILTPIGLQQAVQRRRERLVLLGICLLVLAEPMALLAQVASLGAGSPGELIGAILASSFGRVLAQRLGIALLLWVILGSTYQEMRSAKIGIASLGLLLALVDGEASHAISKEPIWLGLLANMVHIVAMGLWVGGLLALLIVWREKALVERRKEIRQRFGQLAIIAVSELILSGLLMAWLRLNQPISLFTTFYGRVLLSKICLLPLVLVLVIKSRRVHPDEQSAWWQIEGIGILLILILAGLLVSLPPPN